MKLLEEIKLEELRGCSRRELEAILAEELKYIDETKLEFLIVQLRKEKVQEQKAELEYQMKADVEKCLGFIKVLKSKDAAIIDKQKAFEEVMRFLKDNDTILSLKFLSESYSLLEFVASKEDIEVEDVADIDYIMKRRAKMYADIKPARYQFTNLRHTKFVDLLIKKDAEFGLDKLVKKHIKSATEKEYGDLIRQEKGTADFYYLTASAYEEMYQKFREELEESAQTLV